MGTWARLFTLSLLLVSGSAYSAGWDISFLDGSSDGGWNYEELAGGASIVDVGGGNHAIECFDYQDEGYSEFWIMTDASYLTLGGVFRFMEVPADPGYYEGIFMQLVPGGGDAPMPGWAVHNGSFAFVNAHNSEDLVPFVKPLDLNTWHSCGITVNREDSGVIGWFDGQIIFNGTLDDVVNFGAGYVEFGASTFWGENGGARVQWDWAGVGSGEVPVSAVPEPSSFMGLLAGIALGRVLIRCRAINH